MKLTFVICLTMDDFMNWRKSIDFSIPNRDCVVVLTGVDGYADPLRGFQIDERTGHRVVRWGDYANGKYWHEVEDNLAVAEGR